MISQYKVSLKVLIKRGGGEIRRGRRGGEIRRGRRGEGKNNGNERFEENGNRALTIKINGIIRVLPQNQIF